MANKKTLIIGGLLIGTAGIFSFLGYRSIRNKRILNNIFDKLNDVTSSEGQQAGLSDEDKIKGSYALDPNFWRQGRGTAKPDPNKLIPSAKARDFARQINDKIANWKDYTDDESGIMSVVKQHKSQGQLSQTAYAYGTTPLNFGSMADDLQDALKGNILQKDYLQELNNYINSLPL